MPEISPGVKGFRVRCPVPNGFRVEIEPLCRPTPSHFASIRIFLTGLAQSAKLLTALDEVPSASGHLAQRARRVWVFSGGRTYIFWGGIQRRRDGPSIPTCSPPPPPPSSFTLSFLNCCSYILFMFHVCGVCFLAFARGRCPLPSG